MKILLESKTTELQEISEQLSQYYDEAVSLKNRLNELEKKIEKLNGRRMQLNVEIRELKKKLDIGTVRCPIDDHAMELRVGTETSFYCCFENNDHIMTLPEFSDFTSGKISKKELREKMLAR